MYENKTVLVVDDAELQRFLLTMTLQELGVGEILTAEDGLEAVRKARYYKPDLVLMDLVMPNVDGLEACEKIRLFANKVVMPIIIITGQDKTKSIDQVFSLGANDYFEKPFNENEVINRIKFYLDYNESYMQHIQLQELIKADLEIARTFQTNTLPDEQQIKEQFGVIGIDIAPYIRSETLAGDSWAVYYLSDMTPVLLVFDVTGHGINASINNSFIHSVSSFLFESYKHLDQEDFSVSEYFEQLNKVICQQIQTGTFCAAMCVVLKHNEVEYVGCGIPDLKVVSEDGTVDTYPCSGLPLGVSQDNFLPSRGAVNFDEDKLFFVATDGLTESTTVESYLEDPRNQDLEGERFLDKCLKTASSKIKKHPAKKHMDFIIGQYERAGFNLDNDDITALVFKKSGW